MAELDALRVEVARLHDLLGLPTRTDDEHQQAWAPTLFSGTGVTPDVTEASGLGAKLELIRLLFGARSDVYAQRWENSNTLKSGWSPVVRGGWTNKTRKAKDYLPLTDDAIAAHLRGDVDLGIYPLLQGDTCALLACDFDDGGSTRWRSWTSATPLVSPAVLERSRSGMEATCGCSSASLFPPPRRGRWGWACSAKR